MKAWGSFHQLVIIFICTSMVLGISEIKKLIRTKNLIIKLSKREKFEPEGCVIDLRLDKLYKLKGKGYLGINERRTPDCLEVASYIKNVNSQFIIKPREYYITKTIEELNLPKNIIALFVPRATLFRSGLILKTGLVDPGYSGSLFFGIYNASNCNFTIELGARYCSVYFLEIKGKIKNLYRGQWQGGRVSATKLEKQI